MNSVADVVSTLAVVGVVAAMVGALVALMERTHRRTRHLSRTPFGADLSADSDLRRTRDELRAVEGRQERSIRTEPTPQPAHTHTQHRAYPAPSAIRHV